MRADRGGEAGFTLLEALIAFAIAAFALAALLQGALTGLRAAHTATRTEEALARARSRLAALEAAPLAPADQRGPTRQAGFTLLEVLVALAVLGFLTLGLAGGVRFGLGAWDSQARLIDRTGDLDVADRALRRIVAQLVPTDDA